MKRNKKIIRIEVSNSSHMNWPAARDFDVFVGSNLILSGTREYDTIATDTIDTYDDGNYDRSYQESGDFNVGYTNYIILDTYKVTVNYCFVAYFPYAALKRLLKYFETDSISLNW